MKIKAFVLFGFLGSAALGQQANAQASAPVGYLSLSAGPDRATVDCSGTTTCDRTSAAAKVLFGYHVTPNLAVEASYAYLGKVSATAASEEGTATASIKGQSFGVGLAGRLPFGSHDDWTAIARIGIASNQARTTASFAGETENDSERHTLPYFGLAVDYSFSPGFSAGLAWDSTKIKYLDSSSRINALSVVGTFHF